MTLDQNITPAENSQAQTEGVTLSALQAAILAAITQVAGVAAAFGLFTSGQAHIIVSAAGSVLSAVVLVVYAIESWKTAKIATASIVAPGLRPPLATVHLPADQSLEQLVDSRVARLTQGTTRASRAPS